MKTVKNSSEIFREGGMVTAFDITGVGMDLTFDEARFWPLVRKIVNWDYDQERDLWVSPDQPTGDDRIPAG